MNSTQQSLISSKDAAISSLQSKISSLKRELQSSKKELLSSEKKLQEANLCRPLRYPGRNCIVGEDYWNNNKHYILIAQPTLISNRVETSRRRECYHCKKNNIVVQICTACNKWYCPHGCHQYNNCNGIVNSYR